MPNRWGNVRILNDANSYDDEARPVTLARDGNNGRAVEGSRALNCGICKCDCDKDLVMGIILELFDGSGVRKAPGGSGLSTVRDVVTGAIYISLVKDTLFARFQNTPDCLS